MNSRLHKSVFRRWRDQNEKEGSGTGFAILDYLANEPEPHPLRDTYEPIPRVPMPAPEKSKDVNQ